MSGEKMEISHRLAAKGITCACFIFEVEWDVWVRVGQDMAKERDFE